ncbi:MAG: hypothetical protein WCX64_06235 [Candidatus Micrarchaeia archaeon]|jgi:hypothetical protein
MRFGKPTKPAKFLPPQVLPREELIRQLQKRHDDTAKAAENLRDKLYGGTVYSGTRITGKPRKDLKKKLEGYETELSGLREALGMRK